MITTAITAFFQALAKIFSCTETKIEKQCETDILKSKKRVEKKSDKQEDLILDMMRLILKYQPSMSDIDKVKVKRYLKRIKRVN